MVQLPPAAGGQPGRHCGGFSWEICGRSRIGYRIGCGGFRGAGVVVVVDDGEVKVVMLSGQKFDMDGTIREARQALPAGRPHALTLTL